jgi:voltage-gated potassium channel
MTESIFSGHIKGVFEKKRMDKVISKLSDHYIICGYGRIGEIVCRELTNASKPVIVIDNDPEIHSILKKRKIPYIGEDATEDETLIKAGIKKAKKIITLLDTDAANVYIVLTAQHLNKNIKITSRAGSPSAEKKIIQAGADEVIQPYEIGAKKIALTVLKPSVLEFIDLAVHSTEIDLSIEQIKIKKDSQLDNVTIGGISLRAKTGGTLLAVKREENKLITILSPDFLLKKDDIIIILGTEESIKKIRRMAQDK